MTCSHDIRHDVVTLDMLTPYIYTIYLHHISTPYIYTIYLHHISTQYFLPPKELGSEHICTVLRGVQVNRERYQRHHEHGRRVPDTQSEHEGRQRFLDWEFFWSAGGLLDLCVCSDVIGSLAASSLAARSLTHLCFFVSLLSLVRLRPCLQSKMFLRKEI